MAATISAASGRNAASGTTYSLTSATPDRRNACFSFSIASASFPARVLRKSWLDLRVQVRINDGGIGFQHGRRRQRRHGVLHECSSGRAVLMIATKGSPRRVRLDDARSMRCVNDLFAAVVVAIIHTTFVPRI